MVTEFQSILFERPARSARPSTVDEPAYLADLNLDQVVEAVVAGREQYDLEAFFHAPLHDVTAVRYRHEVLRDLERDELRESVETFAVSMQRMRDHLARVEKLYYAPQKQAWFLDAVAIYCEAVRRLADGLAEHDPTSRGFQGLRAYVAAYAESERFSSLAAEAQALKDALARVRYSVRIHGSRVTVSRYEGEENYSAEVEATFAKFQQGAVQSYLVGMSELGDMDHVEAQIVDRVALLHGEVFACLAEFYDAHREYLDPTIGRFDREVQFYLAYLELVARLTTAGLPFCFPRVSARSKEISAEETFDLALANKLVTEGREVVRNDFALTGQERIVVVTGPNNGGKTTFARMFGQLHHLAGLGLPVPGRNARLFLPDRIYTHFEKEEDITTLRGKFEDELVRVHRIVEQVTGNSVVVMNESFGSTALDDALFVGTAVVRRILELDCLGVYVTFVDEIASLGEATVSMVSQIVPENPAERTFKVVRQPADGLAYAWAIAEKYGLTYDRLLERIAS